MNKYTYRLTECIPSKLLIQNLMCYIEIVASGLIKRMESIHIFRTLKDEYSRVTKEHPRLNQIWYLQHLAMQISKTKRCKKKKKWEGTFYSVAIVKLKLKGRKLNVMICRVSCKDAFTHIAFTKTWIWLNIYLVWTWMVVNRC